MPRPTELYRIDGATILNFTALAVLISVDGEQHWFPFSQIREPDSLEIRGSRGLEVDLVIPAWMAKEKGLI